MKRIILFLLDQLPLKIQTKAKIIINVLLHDWRMLPYPTKFSFQFYSDLYHTKQEEIYEKLSGLDKKSISTVEKYIQGQLMYFVPNQTRCFYSMKGLFSKEEKKEGYRLYSKLCKIRKKYGFKNDEGDLSSLLYVHGLSFQDHKVIEYIKGKIFIDAGAYIGDSCLGMLTYQPERVISFEISHKSALRFIATMKNNHISENRFELINAGLGDQDCLKYDFLDTGSVGTSSLNTNQGNEKLQIYKLDTFWTTRTSKIGFIKTDVEGAGVSVIKGAKQTILKNRPVLSLAIYHSKEELFDTYSLLKSWNLNYEFKIMKLTYPWENAEIVLFGIPKECIEKR